MATVRISKDLLDVVRHNINVKASSVYGATVEPKNPFSIQVNMDAVVETALNKMWKGYEHLRPLVPQSWLPSYSCIDLRIADTPEFRIQKGVSAPPNNNSKGLRGSWVEVALDASEVPQDLLKSWLDFCELKEQHEIKFEKVEKAVLSFLEASKSVNDAVKKYPDIALYLPDSIKQRMSQVVGRKARDGKTAAVPEVVLTEEDRALLSMTGLVGALYEND